MRHQKGGFVRKEDSAPDPKLIKSTREALGLTQREAAGIVHSGLRAWQNWEQGVRSMQYAAWKYFVLMTRNRMPVEGMLSTGLGATDRTHPCFAAVHEAWESTKNLESARLALAKCLKEHGVDPWLASYQLVAQLLSSRDTPTPEEAAQTIKNLMEDGANLLEVAEWLQVLGS